MVKIIKNLLIAIILLETIFCASFAKYQSNEQVHISFQIPNAILEIERDKNMLITAISPKASYVFKVKNYKENNINQVDLYYYIEIIGKIDNSINIKLYKDNEEIIINDNKTEKYSISKDVKEEHVYCLEIMYDNLKNQNNNDINENIKLKVHAVQFFKEGEDS